jgi:type II secretory pathway component GspD/PulD (secretin)
MKSRWNRGSSFTMVAVAGLLGAGIPAGPAIARMQDTQAAPDIEAALVRAREAADASRWEDAVNAWNEVLRLQPGNAEAEAGRVRALRMLEQGSTIEDVIGDTGIQHDLVIAEFDAAMQRANELLARGDFAGARTAVVTAEVQLRRGRTFLSESEFTTRSDQADALELQITNAQTAAQLRQQEQNRIDAERAQSEAEAAAARQRHEQIIQLLQRVRALQMEMKYGEALQVVDQILFLDPLNPAAQTLRDSIRVTRDTLDLIELEKRREFGNAYLSRGVKEALIPPQPNLGGPGARSTTGIMEYPEDWPILTLRRTGAAGYVESESDRRTRASLSQAVSVDFTNNDLDQVVAYLRSTTGLQFYADWKALDFIGVEKEDQVNLKIGEVPAEVALQRILEQLGDESDRPQWAIEDGVVVISSNEALRKKVATIVYDIRDLLFEVPYFDNAPEFDLESAVNQGNQGGQGGGSGGGGGGFGGGSGGGGQGGGGGGGGGSLFDSADDDPERRDREELIQDIIDIIQEQVDTDGWKDNGGETGSIQELNGNLIITNTPNNHLQIENLLGQLREIRSLQINVEGRLLTVQMDWFEQIGIDLDLYFNTNNSLFNAAREIDPNFQLKDFFNQTGDGKGTLKDPVVFQGISGVTNDTGGLVANTTATGAQFGIPDAATPDPGDIAYVTGPVGAPIRTTSGFSPINFQQGSYGANGTGLTNQLAELGEFGSIAAVNPALAAGVSFLDDVQVDLLINATQADRRSVTLTAPRLTLFNGQRSWVAVQFSQAFVSGLTPVTGDNSGAFQPNIGTLREGFVLDVEAVISADRRYVTMTVIFDLNNNEGFRESDATEFGGAAGGGTDGDDGGDGAGRAGQFTGRVELPQLSTTSVRTTVSVPDKGTILLGGQRVSNEIEVETGVPILSKIPIVNRFFTNRLTSKDEQSLLLLIRPEVIIQEENEDVLFPGLSDRAVR